MGLLVATGAGALDFGTIPDPFTGNYSGTRTVAGTTEPLHAIVINYGNFYEIALRAKPSPRAPRLATLQAHGRDTITVRDSLAGQRPGKVVRATEEGVLFATSVWDATGDGTRIHGRARGMAPCTFDLTRVPFTPSPTLGAKPPQDAVVLFDGTTLDAWQRVKGGGKADWTLLPDEQAFQVAKGKRDIMTRQAFGSYHLHLEFQLEYNPRARGQGRSNSGVYHMGRYETQVLDSFGLHGRDNEAGGIYKVGEPKVNAVYPPGLWQTYDVDVTAPVFENGKKVKHARITARLNGVLIQDDIEVPRITQAGLSGPEQPTGPILLQDHSGLVKYRNIWIQTSGAR